MKHKLYGQHCRQHQNIAHRTLLVLVEFTYLWYRYVILLFIYNLYRRKLLILYEREIDFSVFIGECSSEMTVSLH